VLAKSERLKKSSEFNAVYCTKKSVANSLLILYVGKNKNLNEIPSRVGFVVGKKVHKKSTKRNRIKRLMREAYRNYKRSDEYIQIPWETLIFIARPAIVDVNYKQVYDAIVNCLKKANKKFMEK